MRVLHVPYTFYPDAVGGTEVYVEQLARVQRSGGYDAAVAAPGAERSRSQHGGIPVWRFPASENPKLRELYGEGDQSAALAFADILDEFRPDIVHLHALTSAVSIRLAEKVKHRDIPLVMNYHTPTISCTRGTLLKWGATICDGKLNGQTCTACTLQGKGASRGVAELVARTPAVAGRIIGRAGLAGGLFTALRMSELIDIRISSFHRMMQMADRVVALCEWTRSLLRLNGVSETKLALCRQGISWEAEDYRQQAPIPEVLPLRLAFFGRLDETKGAHIVIQALNQCPDLPVQLDLFGVQQSGNNRYSEYLRTLASGDSRIQFLPPVPSGDVVRRLQDYAAILVPSQGLETGPLVVLEAFAAGTPVIGSRLGGIAELVSDGIDGILVDPVDSAAAWANVLKRVSSQAELLPSLKKQIRTPRTMAQVALEIEQIYQDLVGAIPIRMASEPIPGAVA